METTQTQAVHRSYGTAKGWRYFIYLFIPLLILVFLSSPFWLYDGVWNGATLALAGGFWLFGLFLCYALYETIKARHIITDEALIYQGAFRRKELPFHAIRGYRVDQQYTHILPSTSAYPKIRIGYTSEKYEEIQQWLADHYPNLDEEEREASETAILEDHNLGRTTSEREANLVQARSVATVFTGAGWVVGAWLLFIPQPYDWAIGAALVLPLLAVGALCWFRNVLRPDEQKNSAYPSVFTPVFIPTIALLLRGILDFELLTYAPIWPMAGVVAALLVGIILVASQEFVRQRNSRWSVVLTTLALGLLYGYSATVAINCAFDTALPTRYMAKVLNKHSTSGKSTTYYLTVTPWGPRTATDDITVSEEYYEQVQSGATIGIYQFPGRLGASWFIAGK